MHRQTQYTYTYMFFYIIYIIITMVHMRVIAIHVCQVEVVVGYHFTSYHFLLLFFSVQLTPWNVDTLSHDGFEKTVSLFSCIRLVFVRTTVRTNIIVFIRMCVVVTWQTV